MNLSFLRRETVIGLNKIFLGFEKFRFYPRYLVAINPTVLEQSASQLKALNCVRFLDHRAAQFGIEENAMTHFIVPTLSTKFSTNLPAGYQEGFTVTHAALQVAYFLGFQEVILIGLDHRYSFTGSPNESHVLQGPDRNHFSENYFGHGQKWDNPDLANSERFYLAAREAYQADGRRIIDATLEGACTVFEKGDYRELFPVS
jgi:hypothetical protein